MARHWRPFGAGPLRQEFSQALAQAGANAERTAALLDSALAQWPDDPDNRAEIAACEQEGDRVTRKVVARLREVRMAPGDRHDAYLLTSAIDDVVDNLEEVSEEIAAYRIEAPMELAALPGGGGGVVRSQRRPDAPARA